MRVIAIAAGPAMVGVHTENGNRVGDITVGGTVGLIAFVGILTGVFGGVLYAAMRPWLASLARWGGLAYGVLLFATFATPAISSANSDFHRFGPPGLNVVLFASLFLLFGVVIVAVAERLDRATARFELATGGLRNRCSTTELR